MNIYAFSDNSCYIDTLLIVMLDNLSKKFMYDMIQRSYDISDYESIICDGKKSVTETIEYAAKIRDIIVQEYNNINSGGTSYLTCTKFRNVLTTCLPGIRSPEGSYVTYNVAEVYTLLADLFPKLKISAPYNLIKNSKVIDRGTHKLALFSMWDFVGKSVTEVKPGGTEGTEGTGGDDGEAAVTYLWNEIDSNILVFNNTSAPVILDFSVLTSERSVVSVGTGNYVSVIEKQRIFSEVILGSYRLTAAIMLQGYVPGKESGTHYVACYINKSGEYYFYNDIGPVYRKIEAFPPEVFKYTPTSGIPQMYIYARMK